VFLRRGAPECAILVDFGILSILGIVAALLGDLLIGPVLLVRFGAFGSQR